MVHSLQLEELIKFDTVVKMMQRGELLLTAKKKKKKKKKKKDIPQAIGGKKRARGL